MSAEEPSKVATIGVVLTCFNRREKTRQALASLEAAAGALSKRAQLRIFLTDDGSTDGTADMVRSQYPAVHLIQGGGTLYWAGGMRVAIRAAMNEGFDHYLWLNDDTRLFPHALEVLLTTSQEAMATNAAVVVVGATQDQDGKLTYGGLVRRRKRILKTLSFDLVPPANVPVACDTHNGNCVLVSSAAALLLGNFDDGFVHGMADMDYGLRAAALGIPVLLAPGFAGVCVYDHSFGSSYHNNQLSLKRRWKMIMSPKGMPPRAWIIMCRRHGGAFWPLHFVWPYLKIIAHI